MTSANSFLPLTPVTYHVLLTLMDGAMHGYRIKREVEERTDGVIRLGAGTLYEGLRRMEGAGLISEVDAPDDEETQPTTRWRFYDITPTGRSVLAAEVARLETDAAAGRAKVMISRPGRA